MIKLAKFIMPLLALSFLWPSSARAATLLYGLSGPQNFSFTVPLAPTPSSVLPDGFVLSNVIVSNVTVTIGGVTQVRNIGFAEAFAGGGFIILNSGIDLSEPQLFSGTNAQPTLLQGQFNLASTADPTIRYSLAVRPAVAPVPEPGTWLLLLLGFAAVGARMRRPMRLPQTRRSGLAKAT